MILPEQSQLEVVRKGSERTLFDQMVELMMKHQQEFPLSILHQTRSDSQPKVRHGVDQMVELMMKHQQEFPLSILHQTRLDSQPKVRHTVDQMVELRMKHQQEFPLSILHRVKGTVSRDE